MERLNSVTLSTNMLNSVRLNSIGASERKREKVDYIKFADSEVKAICLANFDANGDGKIQFSEAEVANLDNGTYFKYGSNIKTFNELKYFTYNRWMRSIFTFNDTIEEFTLPDMALQNINTIACSCSNLRAVKAYDLSSLIYWSNPFGYCSKLQDFSMIKTPKISFGFPDSPLLTLKSVENIIEALLEVTNTPTLTLNVEAIDRYEVVHGIYSLEDECIEKGWALAESGTRQGIAFSDNACTNVMVSAFDTNADGKVDIREAYDADSFYELFHNNTSVKVIDKLEYFSNITTLYRAFKGCSALETIGINSMDTSNVTTIYSLFSGDGKLTEIDMSNMNLSNVTDMQWAFNKCASLVALNMSGVELTSCTTAYKAFEGCVALANFSIGSMPKADVSFAVSSQLSAQSVENIINALGESAGNSVTLHSDAISRYDALHGEDACEDAIIEKGWTLVYA